MKTESNYDFNSIADDYNKHHYAHSNFTQIIKDSSDIGDGFRILDVGCGTGNETIKLFNSFNCKVLGIEPAIDMLNVGKRNEDRIDWRIGIAENIPLENNSVDIITCYFSIHHFNDLNKAFTEFRRILKPRGMIFIFSISHPQMKSSMEYKFFPELLNADLERVPSISEIYELCSSYGFYSKTIETEYEMRKIDLNYLQMVKNKYRSGLRMLNTTHLNQGIKRVEDSVLNNLNIIDRIFCSVIISQRSQEC